MGFDLHATQFSHYLIAAGKLNISGCCSQTAQAFFECGSVSFGVVDYPQFWLIIVTFQGLNITPKIRSILINELNFSIDIHVLPTTGLVFSEYCPDR
jgi:hypothetical protein